jgi:hypothetical protein
MVSHDGVASEVRRGKVNDTKTLSRSPAFEESLLVRRHDHVLQMS